MPLMKEIEFAIGQEPKVLIAVSEECSAGNCEKCPGIFKREDHPKGSILCVHSCHDVRNQGN